jgi:hypothetical protein
VAAAALAACAGNSGGIPPVQSAGAPLSRLAPQAAVLAPCSGQKSEKTYARDAAQLSTKGGSLCIPTFGGFGGSLEYPSADPSIRATLISSTTNYTKNLPSLGSGTPLFYLQIALSGATTFGTDVPAGGGLVGKTIVPGQTYTALGQVSADGITEPLPGCYLKAGKSAFGGSIGGLGSLLKGQNVPVALQGIIEIYPGKHASAKC